ncbi:unnamed protein product [[Actinomadura] parvosata subsp. kistnae]|uniref:Uncharacterized protein n=1 Tax=[Actinomadura] parvosata subsp. kistnae TaxID=1909395 RepID=A0A1V0A1Q7_9ACTN|nr:hypothetical protein [Nonomuraea sp. ATCC 55076]AQZ64092.1 hypothetical protein BKM31_23860 [Nonomuraea sp. ATCC 55076]SPL87437.1 unnamed protein product [Actinomadura parvosata subsp. kistnae]
MAVLHPKRVAWEGARTFVSAATTDAYWWLSDTVGQYLGLMYQLQLCETRLRLQGEPDVEAAYEEVGAWRARLDDLLTTTPSTTSLLTQLITETTSRLP